MTPRRAPWTQAILDLLADGDWHPYTAVIAAGAMHVPPGQAARTAERTLTLSRQRRHTVKPRPRDQTAAIARGQRERARDSLFGQIRRGHIERSATTAGVELRLATAITITITEARRAC